MQHNGLNYIYTEYVTNRGQRYGARQKPRHMLDRSDYIYYE